ncbi:hypothetical protein EEL87_17495 [Salmonella enterica]|nr:hypothetical protein [Salmonella enterica subsp. enterica serovar Nima]EBV7250928.1 hypothetical protein [Salmonella enterica subsp. enterica serovar Pomona]MHH77571.1 hypothetical protein [Salmonella enterica]EBU8229660.1 hypothetical protein [Salmonella enterica subsp. enterica serovar Nima]EBU8922327.1 hypothetical protein [Salmonella enterica subsp. enterica serovar Nima]
MKVKNEKHLFDAGLNLLDELLLMFHGMVAAKLVSKGDTIAPHLYHLAIIFEQKTDSVRSICCVEVAYLWKKIVELIGNSFKNYIATCQ